MNSQEEQSAALRRAGSAVAERRLEQGMSQAALAKAADVDAKTLRSLERGQRWPQEANRAKIAEALGWRHGALDDLLAGSTPEVLAVEGCSAMSGFNRWQHWQNEIHDAVHSEFGADLTGLSIETRMEILSDVLTDGRSRMDLMTAVEGRIILQELAAVFSRRVDEARRAHPDYRKPTGGLGLTPEQIDDAEARGIPVEEYADSILPADEDLGQWAADDESATGGPFAHHEEPETYGLAAQEGQSARQLMDEQQDRAAEEGGA